MNCWTFSVRYLVFQPSHEGIAKNDFRLISPFLKLELKILNPFRMKFELQLISRCPSGYGAHNKCFLQIKFRASQIITIVLKPIHEKQKNWSRILTLYLKSYIES